MSEPVTNSEIEDVLSSIRRLVSEEDRKPSATGAENEADADRLVLTPALRVAEAETAAAAEPTVGEIEQPAGIDGSGDDVESDQGHEQAHDHDHEVEADEDMDYGSDPDADHDENTEASAYDEPVSEAQQPEDEGEAPAGLEAKIAELEALIGRADDEWEPDEAGQDAYAGDTTAPLEWEDAADTASGADPNEDRGESETPVETEMELAPSEAMDAGWSVDEIDDDPEDDLDDLFADDAPVIDEAALRDMVSEIVREELQGELGERITRNVRKLVRREIQRALTTKQFD